MRWRNYCQVGRYQAKSKEQPAPADDLAWQSRIVTVTAAEQEGLQGDVLIVASGEPARMPLRDFQPRFRNRKDRDVLVIDFTDEFDAQAKQNSQNRERVYVRRGWSIVRK